MNVYPAWVILEVGPVMYVYPDTMETQEMDFVNPVLVIYMELVVQCVILDQVNPVIYIEL